MKKIFLIVFLILLSAPFFTDAGLVPCGGPDQDPCTFCDFFVLFDNIIKFILLTLVPPIAVLMVVIAGVYYFAATGDPSKITQATGILRTIIIGLIIIYGAWIFVSVFFLATGVADWTGLRDTGTRGWYIIDCSVDPVDPVDPIDPVDPVDPVDPEQHTLTLKIGWDTGGPITPSLGHSLHTEYGVADGENNTIQIEIDYGTEVEAIAGVPPLESAEWGGACSGTAKGGDTCAVIMTQNRSIELIFEY